MITPSEWLQEIRKTISKQDKYAVLSAFFIAILTHMRIFVQDIPNHDGMSSIYFDQNMITSGRWFLTVVCGISSDYTLPWIIGVLSCLYLSIAAMFLCRFLQLQETYSVVLISGLLVTYPVLSSNFAYMFTADGYMFAIMLAIIAVYTVERYKLGFLVGGCFLAFSMGIYQSYLAIAMVLCVYAVCRVFTEHKETKLRFKITSQYVGMGAIGAVLYYVFLQILLLAQQTQLSGYQGIGSTNEASLLDSIYSIYADFFVHTIKGNILVGNGVSACGMILLACVAVIGLVGMLQAKGLLKDPWIYLVLIASLIAIPICFNVTLLLSPDVTYHSLMRMQWVLLPIFTVAICDKARKPILQWACLLIGIILVVRYAVVCNIGYFNLEKKYEKTYAYCLRLLDRMEETEGYYHGMPVAMIGVVGDHYLTSTDLTVSVTDSLLNVNGDYLFYTAENYQAFFEYYFGVSIALVDIEEMPEIIQSEEYLALEAFPQENAMIVVDGVLYIKTEN